MKTFELLLGFILIIPSAPSQEITIQIKSSNQSRVDGIMVCQAGTTLCSDNVTDPRGLVTMPLPPGSQPGGRITLEIPNLPADMVVISPAGLNALIPAPGASIDIVLEPKRQRNAIRSPNAARSITRRVNEERAKGLGFGQTSTNAEQHIKDALANQLEVKTSDIDNAIEAFTKHPADLLDAAESAHYQEDYRTAARLLRTLLSLSQPKLELNDIAHAWFLLGSSEMALGKLEASAEALRHAYMLNPSDSNYGALYVMLLFQLGDIQKAVDISDSELQIRGDAISSQDTSIFSSLAINGKMVLMQIDEAAESVENLLSLSKSWTDWRRSGILCLAADLSLFKNDLSVSRSLIRESSKITIPEDDEYARGVKYGCLLVQAGIDLKENAGQAALDSLNKAKSLLPPEPHSLFLIEQPVELLFVSAYEQLGKLAQAEATYKQLIARLSKAAGQNGLYATIARLGLSHLLYDQSRFQEALDSLGEESAAGDVLPSAVPVVRMAVQLLRGRCLVSIGQYKKAVPLLIEAQSLSRPFFQRVKNGIVESYSDLGRAYSGLEQYADAEKAYKDGIGLIIGESPEEKRTKCSLLNSLGMLYSATNRYSEAETYLEQSFKLINEITDANIEETVAEILYYKGIVAFQQRKLDEALGFLQRALKIESQVLDHESLSYSYTEARLGLVEYWKFDDKSALLHLAHAEKVQSRIQRRDDDNLVELRLWYGWDLLETGDYGNARAQAQAAYSVVTDKAAHSSASSNNAIDALNLIARSSLKMKDYVVARKAVRDLLQFEENIGRNEETSTWLTAAMSAIADGDVAAAIKWSKTFVSWCDSHPERSLHACAEGLAVEAQVVTLTKNANEAEGLLRSSVGRFEKAHYELAPALADTYLYLADLFHRQHERERELESLRKALQIRRQSLGQENALTSEVQARIDILNK